MRMNLFQKFYHKDLQKVYRNFTTSGGNLILDNVVGNIPDFQNYLINLKKNLDNKSSILISYHNPDWEPILTLASKLGLRKKVGIQNWLDENDISNILNLSGFKVTSIQKKFFGITTITIAKIKNKELRIKKDYSVSIIIPAKNEEGNITKIIPSFPKFGKWQEIIFVEGNSTDNTWTKIEEELSNKHSKYLHIKAFKQRGKGKADAVRLGLDKATGDILIIYDADRTVAASDLPKFYNALVAGLGKFINGSRLVYPMEKDAMRTLNKIGNKMFSLLFTWILGQRFKDTLCGTKAIFKKDFIKYNKDYKRYLKVDPFGDFALIFTAIKHNLKVVEIPIRYKERVYGSTNINRFYHGFMLIKMTLIAFKEFKVQ